MPRLRLEAAAVNQTPLDWDGNRDRLIAALDAARQAGAALVCLPELAVTGYGCEDAFFSSGVRATALEVLRELAPFTRGIAAPLGLPIEHEGRLYNACVWACDGRLVGIACKQHLAGDGIHYEPRWFHPWPAGKIAAFSLGDAELPLGDLLFDCDGVRIGFEICRDAWVERRPGARLASRGARILLNPSASHFAFGKQETRRGFCRSAARDWGVAYVYANLLGNESGRAVYDGGAMIAHGEALHEGPRFSFADFVLATADVDLSTTARRPLAETPPLRAGVASSEGVVDCGFRLPTADDCRPPASPAAWDGSPPSKEEEFARAVALGLFDYLRKSGANGFVISLSGGADSSAVAVLCWLMLRFAAEELGGAATAARLPSTAGVRPAAADRKSADGDSSAVGLRSLLACVYQATRHSGEVTRRAAENVAAAIGAEFIAWNVDGMVDAYVDVVAAALQRPLAWEGDDVALQNVQARARGPGAWLLANLRQALLLTTSNRSEAAVGYATMDGDTCGGLAPIAGIDKAYLLDWLRWMETAGPHGVGPLPALAAVNCQQPTAELRPPAHGQTDEGDLMPYRVLDVIERAAIRDRLLPHETFAAVRPLLAEHSATQVREWVEKFFRLWRRNQWKRERYAPSFHLDDENLDPKTWCRFPILSGSLARDFEKLDAQARKAVAAGDPDGGRR